MSNVYYGDDWATVYHGDCIEVMRGMPDESVDAVVTDPPYGIRFMGEAWDGADIVARQERGKATSPMPAGVGGPNGGFRSLAAEAGRYDQSANATRLFQEWCAEWAAECLRVLKPGGHMLAFGSPRAWHRLACGVEDAGFEIRDSIAWLYGSGFPKSRNVRADLERIGYPLAAAWDGWGTALKPAFEPCVVARKPLAGTTAKNIAAYGVGGLNVDETRVSLTSARFPTNVVLDDHVADQLDAESPHTVSTVGKPRAGQAGNGWGMTATGSEYADEGGPSRFFPVFRFEAKAPTSERPNVDRVQHPTVKPLALMQWLIRLVVPQGATILDPFAGSGTTVEAGIREGVHVIGIEREAAYLPLIMQRLSKDIDMPLDLEGGVA